MATLLRGRTMAVKKRLMSRMTRMSIMVGFCLRGLLLERTNRVCPEMTLPITVKATAQDPPRYNFPREMF